MARAQSTPSQILTDLRVNGYTILPSPFTPAQLATLRTHAAALTATARAGRWPHVRTVPKQFPPWPSPDPHTGIFPEGVEGIWGVQHLLHPDLDSAAVRAFAEVYFCDALLGAVKVILGDGDEAEDTVLVAELFNMLVAPPVPFQLRWHRDSLAFTPALTPADEAHALGLTDGASGASAKRKAYHTQYNIPLHADSSLHLIPGSHARARTALEAATLAANPYAPLESLPGAIEVHVAAGEIVFYDNDIIHRGVYEGGMERATLHGSVGDARGGAKRAANVLQHGVGEWIGRVAVEGWFGGEGDEKRSRLRERARGMVERLKGLGGFEGGYLHDG